MLIYFKWLKFLSMAVIHFMKLFKGLKMNNINNLFLYLPKIKVMLC